PIARADRKPKGPPDARWCSPEEWYRSRALWRLASTRMNAAAAPTSARALRLYPICEPSCTAEHSGERFGFTNVLNTDDPQPRHASSGFANSSQLLPCSAKRLRPWREAPDEGLFDSSPGGEAHDPRLVHRERLAREPPKVNEGRRDGSTESREL